MEMEWRRERAAVLMTRGIGNDAEKRRSWCVRKGKGRKKNRAGKVCWYEKG